MSGLRKKILDAIDKYSDHPKRSEAIADAVMAVLQEQQPVAWAATDGDGKVEALSFNQSRRFDTRLFKEPMPPSVPEGWELVPTELGTELYDACERARRKGYGWDDLGELMDRIDNAYALKPLAAAPKPEDAT